MLAALLAGCGGAQPPAGLYGPVDGTVPRPAAAGRSWLLPAAPSSDLLYFTAPADPYGIYVYSFPKPALVGAIIDYGYPEGVCSGASGDVFVVDNADQDIADYLHGALQPKAILPYPGGQPTGCAVDPTTGNLAAMNGEDLDASAKRQSSPYDTVWIYAGATGTPKPYPLPDIVYPKYLCYDATGNLFVDGENRNVLVVVELPKGASTFVKIKLDKETTQRVRAPGAIQWSGGYLTIGNDAAYAKTYIDRLKLVGGKLFFSGQTKLNGSTGIGEYLIQDGLVTATQTNAAAIWKYPLGGKIRSTLTQVTDAYGVTLSRAPR